MNEKNIIENNAKEDLVRKILENDRDLNNCHLDEELIHELLSGKISKDINSLDDENLTLGQRTADKIAAFGGSWTFIISFGVILAAWIIINTIILVKHAFDPYPFVFLNLVLSCLAAIQAPIIMMSQNRQTEKDRLTASNDYLVNLKSELIVEHLHYQLDQIMENKAGIADLHGHLEEIRSNQAEILKRLDEQRK